MVISNSGISHIIIGKDSYYELQPSNNILIKNQETKEEKVLLSLDNTFNERYIDWEIDLVDYDDEDLSIGKIYLSRGFYDIFIYNDSELIYTNILFVNFDKKEIGSISDSDIVYGIPD